MTQNKENQQLKTEETPSNNKEQKTEDKKVCGHKAGAGKRAECNASEAASFQLSW